MAEPGRMPWSFERLDCPESGPSFRSVVRSDFDPQRTFFDSLDASILGRFENKEE